MSDDTSKPIGLSSIQKQLDGGTQAKRTSDLLIQPMQSVALSPQNGAVTKRMMLCWLYFLKQIQDMPAATTYRLPMAPLIKFLDTQEYEDVKNDLKSLNATQVEWNNFSDDEKAWGVSTLLSQVEIQGTKHGNFIEISLPPKIESGIRERRGYSELNLLMAKQMRSTAALNLYRICVAYETNPSCVTFRGTPQEWYSKLAGAPLSNENTFQYKYFKRDTINPAITEINTLSDLIIELIEHREGRRVVEIQFSVKVSPQASLDLDNRNPDDIELLSELSLLGIRRSVALTLLKKHGLEHIRKNIAYTLKRQKAMGSEMRDVGKYLRTAIQHNYAESEPDIDDKVNQSKKTEQVTNKKEQNLRLELQKERRGRAAVVFKELPHAESESTWNEYLAHLEEGDNAPLTKSANTKGLKTKAVEVDFLNWYSEKLFSPITEKDLLTFMLNKN